MDTNKIPNELNKRINKAFDNFLDVHPTEEILLLKREYIKNSQTLWSKFDFINSKITWYTSKEGGYFYYFLNLRWVILLSYIIHEYNDEYDEYCLHQIDYYFKFAHPPFIQVSPRNRYTSKDCIRMYNYFADKIKKIKELFGN